MKRRWIAAALVATACAEHAQPAPVTLRVDAPYGLGDALEHATFTPSTAVRSATRVGRSLLVRVDAGARKLRVEVPDACPLDVDLGGAKPGDERRARIAAWLDAGDERAAVGFDRDVTIELRPGCRAAVAGRVTWKQTGGAPLELRTAKNGFSLSLHTRPLRDAREGPLPWGIVPLSPRTRGAVALEATWSDGRRTTRQIVRLASAPRASGLPSLAIGQRVWLGGDGWHLVKAPPESAAEVSAETFMADKRGRYVLADGAGRELALTAGTHSGTPLDCGRSGCHADAERLAATSPMTTVLARAIDGKLAGARSACTLSCHAAGEPGVADGGFLAVARELAWVFPAARAATTWNDVPRALRRVGGVTCTACHGPGMIPERGTRWTVLRSDVCATCHDAPPRYGHVVAWRKSRMAKSDLAPATREGACARCHTTAGFLARLGAYRADPAPPPDAAFGIACAACHAPHGKHVGRALLRDVALPAGFAPRVDDNARASGVCLGCHASDKDDGAPGASAGNLLYEVGPAQPDAKSPPHALAGGCIACHGATPPDSQVLGEGHDFTARPAACSRCHKGGAPEPRDLQARARRLLAKLDAAPGRQTGKDTKPLHAKSESVKEDADARRAIAAVRLVVEDPAAGVHNPRYAAKLLDFAEAWLERRGRR